LEALQQDTTPGAPAVAVNWRSFELRPKGSPPISAEYRARIEGFRPQLNTIARDRYGLELNPGPFGIDSRPALIGEKYAATQDLGAAFHDATMRAYWRDARDVSDRTVLAEIADNVGLPTDGFLAALVNPEYDAQVQSDIDFAHHNGLNGVPALVFAERYLVSGAQPAEVLKRVAAQISAEQNG
jgi:predicted DsbA family dithiol-disulfide isomerase